MLKAIESISSGVTRGTSVSGVSRQLIRDTSTRGKGGQVSRAGRLRASYLYGGRGQFSVVRVQFGGRDEIDSRKLKVEGERNGGSSLRWIARPNSRAPRPTQNLNGKIQRVGN